MLLALAGLSSAAMAQQKTEVVEYEIIQVQDKYQVITNPFWSNWFFSIFPVIIVYLFLSKYIVQGVAMGSVKG